MAGQMLDEQVDFLRGRLEPWLLLIDWGGFAASQPFRIEE